MIAHVQRFPCQYERILQELQYKLQYNFIYKRSFDFFFTHIEKQDISKKKLQTCPCSSKAMTTTAAP